MKTLILLALSLLSFSQAADYSGLPFGEIEDRRTGAIQSFLLDEKAGGLPVFHQPPAPSQAADAVFPGELIAWWTPRMEWVEVDGVKERAVHLYIEDSEVKRTLEGCVLVFTGTEELERRVVDADHKISVQQASRPVTEKMAVRCSQFF